MEILKRFSDGNNRVYMDYAAATPLDRDVFEEMRPYLCNSVFGNPSSIHKEGREAKAAMIKAREEIAELLKVHPDEIVFTSGGTESNNLAITGALQAARQKSKIENIHIITSPIEHSSVLEPIKFFESVGARVTYLPVTKSGSVLPSDLRDALGKETALVSIAMVNNEIGATTPTLALAKVIENWRKENSGQKIYFHTDAMQAPQYLPVSPKELGVDLMTLGASKIYGPKGVGLLYVKRGTEIEPIFRGGKQENKKRAGTENVAGMVGFASALKKVISAKEETNRKMDILGKYFWREIKETIPRAVLNGEGKCHLPAFINISISGIDSEFLIMKLDNHGIAASSASACQNDEGGGSHVIKALPGGEVCYKSSIRFTLGRSTTKKEIDKVVKTLKELI